MNINPLEHALSAGELAAVAGGWCGNEVIPIKFPRPKLGGWDVNPSGLYESMTSSKLDLVALNPQPLPPQEIGFDAGLTLA